MPFAKVRRGTVPGATLLPPPDAQKQDLKSKAEYLLPAPKNGGIPKVLSLNLSASQAVQRDSTRAAPFPKTILQICLVPGG